jgi:NAD(P)H-hydrate epimerase
MRLPAQLLQRSPEAHKGDFGHIFILAGSSRFSGAAVLSALAAMRSGAGLVTLGVPKSINSAIIKIKPKEVMTLPLDQTAAGALSLSGYRKIKDFTKSIDVLVIGPGLSQDKSTQALVRKVVLTLGVPMVIDADGLNALVGHLNKVKSQKSKVKNLIFTPHPGEMSRLLHLSIARIQSNRTKIAKEFARSYYATVVLKGHNTLVADYRGSLYINKTGNPGMATAGSGDVLAGMLAAFLGQRLKPFEAAKYAVYLHGLAGDLAAREKTQLGMIASDIIEKIPEAIKISS